MAATRDTTPILLSGQASSALVGGVPGAPGRFPSAGLVNTLLAPIEVTELIFTVYDPVNAAPTPYLAEVQLAAGRYAITNGFLPIGTLAIRRETRPNEVPAGGAGEGLTIRWVLPRPIVLRPGEGLSGQVRLPPGIAYASGSTVTVTLVARGRRVPGWTPGLTRSVPYASGCAYLTRAAQAPPQAFMNILDRPLMISSVNMRTLTSTVTIRAGDAPPVISTVSIVGPGGLAQTIRRSVVTNARPDAVFAQRSALEVDFVLQEKEDLIITFVRPAAATFNPVGVAIIGYREEVA